MEPVRTCVGCRMSAPRTSLLRVVAQNSEVVIDDRAVLAGRGAWVHPTRECMSAALKRHAFGRALRASMTLDTQTIEKRLYGYGNKVNGSK